MLMQNDPARRSQSVGGAPRLISLVEHTPVLRFVARVLAPSPVRKLIQRWTFSNSSRYWQQRYLAGGDSGAGSHGRLAQFKADTLNAFVSRAGIRTIVELGCGDGRQLQLAHYPSYVGIDVSQTAIDLCQKRFASDRTKRFYPASQLRDGALGRFDLALSLDVIYHLVEDEVFHGYMRSLFACADRFVIVYSSNKSETTASPHVRHREFTVWIAQNEPAWRLVDHVPNAYPYNASRPEGTSFADFYVFGRIAGISDFRDDLPLPSGR